MTRFPSIVAIALALILAGGVFAQPPGIEFPPPPTPPPSVEQPQAEPAPQLDVQQPPQATAAIDPSAVALLRASLEQAAAAQTFVAEFNFKATIDALGISEATNTNYTLSVDRGRKLVGLQKGNGAIGATVVMGPRRLFARMQNLNVHTEGELPATIAGLLEKKAWKDAMDLSFMSLGGRALPDALLADDPAGYLLEGVARAENLGDGDYYGNAAHHLRFTQADAVWEVWLSVDSDPALLGYKPDLTQYMAAAGKDLVKQGKIKAEELNKPGAKMSIEFMFREIAPGAQFDSEAFSFVVPEDSKQVVSLTEGKSGAMEEAVPTQRKK